MYNILICDDEKDIVSALKIYLTAEGYSVLEAFNGRQALEQIESHTVHLVLMDIMMPEMDGITAVSKIREEYNLPVILLTAKSEDTDKVLGLNIGADDYVTKPFNPVEVIARVRSQLRRYTQLGGSREMPAEESVFTVGSISLNAKSREVTVDGDPISLTNTEYEILKLLIQNPGQVFSTKEIYRRVWKSNPVGEENTIAVHIRHLREKLEINPAEPRYLKVVWAQGYKLDNGKG